MGHHRDRVQTQSRRLRRVAIVGASLAVTVAMAGIKIPLAAGSAIPLATVGMAPALPAASSVLGALPAATPVKVSVVLTPSDPAGLTAAATAVATPGSSTFRTFMTPSQVAATFGPTPASSSAVRSWLEGEGLHVGSAIGDGVVLPVTGTASQVSAAFRTPLVQTRLADGRVSYANTQAPSLPAALRPAVTAVVGLDDLTVPATNQSSSSSSASSTRAGGTPPSRCSQYPPNGGPGDTAYSVQQIATAYNYAPLLQAGDKGQGVTIALFELADYLNTDITQFNTCVGVTSTPTRVLVDGGAAISGGTGEVTSDIETASALAPRASLLVYEAPPTSVGTLDNYAQIVQQDRAQVVSTSWGSCESNAASSAQSLAILFSQMALQGQSMLAAAGDAGSASCTAGIQSPTPSQSPLYHLAVSDPASQPMVTAVGGSDLPTLPSPLAALTPSAQTVWNISPRGAGYKAPFDTYPGNSIGGGGISSLWTMPSWQQPIVTAGLSSGVPCQASTGLACREVPDVSGLAQHIPVFCNACNNKGWFSNGGTSMAAPEWAALVALADEQLPQGRLGLVSPSLYALPSADFNDVTVGNNDFLSSSGDPTNDTCTYNSVPNQPCYEATAGYDMASGIGSQNAALIVAGLVGTQVSVITTSLPRAVVGSAYSAALEASAGATPYTWAITVGHLPPGLSLNPATGAITGTPTAPGSSSFTARVTTPGSSGAALSATVVLTIVVSPPSSLAPGGGLNAGSSLVSANGSSTLAMQGDGNLVIYGAHGQPVWWTGTNGSGATHLAFQTDGNAVLYTAAGRPVWWTGTNGTAARSLVITNAGTLVVQGPSGPLWSS